MGRVAKKQRKLVKSGHKIFSLPIWIDPDNNSLQIKGEVYSLSETKDFLLRYCEDLTSIFRLRVVWNSKGRAKVYYAWESIIAMAYEQQILPYNKINLEDEKPPCRISHFILTGEEY